jgi:hypothetical protein
MFLLIVFTCLKMWAQSECGQDQDKGSMLEPGINRASITAFCLYIWILALEMWQWYWNASITVVYCIHKFQLGSILPPVNGPRSQIISLYLNEMTNVNIRSVWLTAVVTCDSWRAPYMRIPLQISSKHIGAHIHPACNKMPWTVRMLLYPRDIV